MSQNVPSIAYVLQRFPIRTETFVYREVSALRDAGINVITVSNRMPLPGEATQELQEYASSTHYINPIQIPLLFVANVFMLFTRYQAYFKILTILLEETSSHPKIWLRNFMHMQGAIYLAFHMRHQHIAHFHAHFSNNATSLAMFMSVLLDQPFSFTVHNNIFADRLLLKSKIKYAKFIASISNYSSSALLDYCSDREILTEKIHIVRCGIEPNAYAKKEDYAIIGEVPTILTASQLVERKGIRYLIEACAILKSNGIPFRCVVAGDGEQRSDLESRVQKLNLQSDIQFTGIYSQSDLRNLFKMADVFVLPSVVTVEGDRDGIPVALMEAMQVGLSVISTNVSGIPELITTGHNGILVSEKDSQALASAIAHCLQDQRMRERLGKHARETILANFNIQNSIQILSQQFEKQLCHGISDPN